MAINSDFVQTDFFALGGPGSIKLVGVSAAQAEQISASALQWLRQFEQKYSRYQPDSVVSQINDAAGSGRAIALDDEAAALVDYAFACHAQSEGLFDITAGVLRRAWNFTSNVLPGAEQVQQLLPLIGLDKAHWQRPYFALPLAGMQIDFGGFGKEYAADRLATFCSQQGVASGLVELAGDLAVIGQGRSWAVGISNPLQPERALATVGLQYGGLASSGDYQRCIRVNNRRYGHILNPNTGWPVDCPAGVTVIADTCLVAGTLTTIAMLKGREHGPAWLQQQGAPYLCIQPDGAIEGSLA